MILDQGYRNNIYYCSISVILENIKLWGRKEKVESFLKMLQEHSKQLQYEHYLGSNLN